MTRKDYIVIAQALREEKRGEGWTSDMRLQWFRDVRAIARTLSHDNKRFDSERFFQACEVEL